MDNQHRHELPKPGDETAFRKLIDDYRPLVFRTAARFLTDPDDCSDLTQEVFIEVWRSASRFRGDSSIATWLYRITVNKALNQLRREKRKNWLISLRNLGSTPEPQTRSDETAGKLNQNDDARLINNALSQLPENQRVAFVLSQSEHLSQKAISEVMGLSESAVESLIHRARTNLRKKLRNHYTD